MRYIVRKNIIQLVGRIWLPPVITGQEIALSQYDVDNCRDENGKITRDSVEQWLCTHSGGFQSILDFFASIEDGNNTVEIDWRDQESRFVFEDCTFTVED